MTDIIKEMDDYKKNGVHHVQKSLEKEINEIEKKMHLINVVHLVSLFEKVIKEENKYNNGIKKIKLVNQSTKLGKTIVQIYFLDLNNDNITQSILDKITREKLSNILIGKGSDIESKQYKNLKYFIDMTLFKETFLNKDFREGDSVDISVDEKGIQELKGLFLNEELQSILSFSVLEKDLNIKEERRENKVKV